MPDGERLARIITTPAEYNAEQKVLERAKLTQIHTRGLSLIRSGAPDDEILATIAMLTSAEDKQELVGAVVIPAETIRGCGQPEKHFAVYDTDGTAGGLPLTKHADLAGTFMAGLSTSAWKTEVSRRRKALVELMQANLLRAAEPQELLAQLRANGI